jgi:hypothetical protein
MRIFLLVLAVLCNGFFLTDSLSAQNNSVIGGSTASLGSLYEEDSEEEDTLRGLTFGLNLGSYFGNAKTANIYNGSGPFAGFILSLIHI